jgi:hypothetical protein
VSLDIFEKAILAGARGHLDLNTPELRRSFLSVHVRQWGLPTGVHPWRIWRTEVSSGCWWLNGFMEYDDTHCKVVGMPAFLFPDGARLVIEDGYITLHHRGRLFYYGRRGVQMGLIQSDAWAIEAGLA